MKLRFGTACGVLMCALAWVTQANGPAPDARKLGIADAMLTYCSKAAPATAIRLQMQLQRMEQGVSQQELSELRSSAEYKEGRASMEEFVAKVDEHNAVKMCSNRRP